MDNEIKDLSERIKELGDKSTQLLTFLSFALAVAVLLWSSSVSASQKSSLVLTMRWWVRAIFPILVGIVPVKEFQENNLRRYNFLRWFKFVLLWVAVIFIFYGVILFARSLAALASDPRYTVKDPTTPATAIGVGVGGCAAARSRLAMNARTA